jgi:integrase/recombinase XerD
MMKPFESFLADTLEKYIAYRRGLGYKEKPLRQSLGYFDRYLQSQKVDWDSFTPSFFLTFRANLKLNPKTVNGILAVTRGFFQYLERLETFKKNPLLDIPCLKELHFIPFVFSPEHIELLLKALQKQLRKDKNYFLHDLAEYTAIVLLARCGLRISEPTRLLRTHVRPYEATLYIEKTKFAKDRLIPAPRSVIREIENYLAVRMALLGEDNNPYLFICAKDKKLTRTQLYPPFRRAVKAIGLDQSKRVLADTTFGGPTPHSLRHAFAVNTLKRIKNQGKSPQNALPILAAYMGHCHYTHTAVYLKVIDAQQRLELYHFTKSREDR